MKSTTQAILIAYLSLFLLPNTSLSQTFCQQVIADNGESNNEYIIDITKTSNQELVFLMQNGYVFDSNMKTMVGRITNDGDSIWLKRYDLVNSSIASRELAQSIVEAPNKDLIFVSNFSENNNINMQGFAIARADSLGTLKGVRQYTDIQLQATKVFMRPSGDVLVFGVKNSYPFAMLLHPDLDFKQAVNLGFIGYGLGDVIELPNGDFAGVTRRSGGTATTTFSVFNLKSNFSAINWISEITAPQLAFGNRIAMLSQNKLAITSSLGNDRSILMVMNNSGTLLNVKEFTHQSYQIRTSDVIPIANGGFIVTGTQGTSSANMFAIQFNSQGQSVNKFDYGTGSVSKSIKTSGGLVLAGHIDVFLGNVEGKIVKTDSNGNSCCDGTSFVIDIDVPTYPFTLVNPGLPMSNFQLTPTVYQTEEYFGCFELTCEDRISSRAESLYHTTVTAPLTIEEITEFNVYPNPASEKLTIRLSETGGVFRFFNASGQIVKEGLLDSESIDVNISSWKKGVYFLKTEQKNKVITKRIILQ